MKTREQQREIISGIMHDYQRPYRSLRVAMVPDEADSFGQAWLLKFFLHNFASHTESQQMVIVEWANTVLKEINNAGVPCGVARVEEQL